MYLATQHIIRASKKREQINIYHFNLLIIMIALIMIVTIARN